jgi:hypothetical protein
MLPQHLAPVAYSYSRPHKLTLPSATNLDHPSKRDPGSYTNGGTAKHDASPTHCKTTARSSCRPDNPRFAGA